MSARLEKLVREWREAQKAIDAMTPQERELNLVPLYRLVTAHNALIEYIDKEMG